MSESPVSVWIAKLKEGDEEAAERLWEQYYARLVRLAYQKLRQGPRRVADEEDAALSAFFSFCRRAEQGQFPRLEDRDDLWQLLVVVTARKAANMLRSERRHKRGGGRVRGESVFVTPEGDREFGLDQIVGDEPTPEYAAVMAEEYENLLECLGDDTLRSIATAKLQGYANQEIADELHCGLRTVERKLRRIRSIWEKDRA